MKLAILIPTLPERSNQWLRLISILNPQKDAFVGDVILISDPSDRYIATGSKRNALIKEATYHKAEYFCMVDDDDIVAPDYVESILQAIESKPDVITFNGWMTTNGAHRVDFEIHLGEKYEERNGKYYRFPNHLCVFKTNLVKDVKFEPIWHGEDFRWAQKINQLGLLKTSVHIDKQLYHYDYKTK